MRVSCFIQGLMDNNAQEEGGGWGPGTGNEAVCLVCVPSATDSSRDSHAEVPGGGESCQEGSGFSLWIDRPSVFNLRCAYYDLYGLIGRCVKFQWEGKGGNFCRGELTFWCHIDKMRRFVTLAKSREIHAKSHWALPIYLRGKCLDNSVTRCWKYWDMGMIKAQKSK